MHPVTFGFVYITLHLYPFLHPWSVIVKTGPGNMDLDKEPMSDTACIMKYIIWANLGQIRAKIVTIMGYTGDW